MSLPPDLRVLCRRLASTKPDDLPRLCPVLANHLLRCGAVLSVPHEAKAKDTSSDVAVHVHRLKTQINTLLSGRSHNGRFAGVVLVKALVDVGGWECLRLSGPWIRDLLSIIQRPGPIATKELSIVTVTRIYSLLHGYQTLVREIASPTIPSFVTACLQLIKPPASGQPLRLPTTVIETVVDALATLVPLYPTTIRPFNAQIRSAIRGYIAPTSSDATVVPQPLRNASHRLLILLHYTAPKNGSGEEWAKAVDGFIRDCHGTADHVFRAVDETWESAVGYIPGAVSYDGEPSGGGPAPDELPPWSGLLAGAERLTGLIELLADCFRTPTKSPVAVPLGSLMDLVARIVSVVPPGAGREDRTQLNASIGREEKDELWSALPYIHVAVLDLLLAMVTRLGQSTIPLARDMLDHTVRIFKAVGHIPSAREAVFTLTTELLSLIGPTLDKLAVDSLVPLIQSCSRDLLSSAGYLQPTAQPAASQAIPNGTTKKPPQPSSNADAFLNPKANTTTTTAAATTTTAPSPARALLASLLIHLPQPHLPPDVRGQLDRAAVLTADGAALLASCLRPYRDGGGRAYASVLPFLARAFPRGREVEVLRSVLRSVVAKGGGGGDGGTAVAAEATWEARGAGKERDEEEGEAHTLSGLNWGATVAEEEEVGGEGPGKVGGMANFVPRAMEIDTPFVGGALGKASAGSGADGSAEQAPVSPLKRKGESLDSGKAKKVEPEPIEVDEDEDGSESDGGSIQIDMTMDDDEDDEDDEEGGDENTGGD